MRKRKNSQIVVKESDFLRLEDLIKRNSQLEAAEYLEDELSRAAIVPDNKIPKNVVCLNSLVTYVDIESKAETKVTLVMPWQADVSQARVSILSPIGTALIGLKKDGYIEWPLPNGAIKKIEIVHVEQCAESHDTQ
ncbi:MAG: nucleoside diphosphate kinase regulator [Marinagarivorans sp.]|nr:nucleoside diphosphate kinase regulator [Marinagarivorans sp.]